MLRIHPLFATLLLTLGCSDPRDRDTADATGLPPINPSDTEGDVDDDDDDEGEGGDKLDVGANATEGAADEGGDECDPREPNATLRGTVYAPNLEIPISGALVYWSDEDPQPVPDGVYCAECVGVPCESDFVLTEADGSFELPAQAGNRKLIVAKGQFLRSVDIEIAEGVNDVAPTNSSLPGEWNPQAGMWIPRVAVVNTNWDSIYNILAKIGMGSVDGSGALQPGTERFDLYTQPDGGALLDDLDAMRQYHIIFIPCMSQVGMGGITPLRIQNIRQWVGEGGKWYVTDWANEYMYETFPEYQTFHGQATNPDLDLYNTTGTVLDPELLAWLQALPPALKDIGGGLPTLLALPSVGLEDNWSGVDATPAVMAMNEEGDAIDVGHHAWVEGPCETCSAGGVRPMTVSAEFGCGRMMFSTYHTNESAHSGLSPQELILLYIILEIGVCHDEPPPKPPPAG
jgi:hypothetical protein